MADTTGSERRNRPAFGALLIVGAVFLMSLQDAVIKYASSDLPLWQIYVLRGLLAIPALLAVALARGGGAAGGRRWRHGLWGGWWNGWALLRAALLVLMYVSLYAAVPVLSLATVAAAFYTGPLFIALLSALLIGEPVGRHGWLAVALGFAGVLVILRPGGDAFSVLAVLPVLSGLFYALAAVVTRSKCHAAAPTALALALNLALLVTGLAGSLAIVVWAPDPAEAAAYPFLFSPWVALTARDWFFIALLAVFIVGIGVGLAAAYQAAPPVIIATFDYSYLIFASVWSYAIFTQPPDGTTIAGMAMIAAAGLFIAGRGRLPRQAS